MLNRRWPASAAGKRFVESLRREFLAVEAQRGEDCTRHGHGQNQPNSLLRTAHINIPIVDERPFTFRRKTGYFEGAGSGASFLNPRSSSIS